MMKICASLIDGFSTINNPKGGPGMMVHTCNPSYWIGGGRRMVVQGQLRQKVRETLSPYIKNKLSMVAQACGPSHSGGKGRRIIM
jgi:hypothetical protein